MSGLLITIPRATQNRRRRASKPALEGLEDRKLLYSTLGGAWAYGSRITYSFVPDGTNIGGVSSNLFSTLNTVAPTATWEAAIESAAAVWSSYANINLALVPDDGLPLGTSGNQQDDSRFGDIRISMIPQSGGAMAFTMLPPPYNGGTAAGDIVFNSNIAWNINANYDLETVALHELGHALGMGHSAISTAVMYAYYNNIKQSLTSDDIAGIQSIYGAYPSDSVDNSTFATATNITGLIDGNAQIALANQSLAGTSDIDMYVVTVPANTTGTMTVSMQSSNLSSVSPRLALFTSTHTTIGQVSLPNSFGATATYTVNNVSPGQVYYIRASAASPLGSYGAFGVLVNFGSSPQAPIPPPNTVVLQQPNQGGGSESLTLPPGSTAIQIGNLSGFADVMYPTSSGGNRLDPLGLSIPVAPGGAPNGSPLAVAAVDALLAQWTLAPSASPQAYNLFSSINNVLSLWLNNMVTSEQLWS